MKKTPAVITASLLSLTLAGGVSAQTRPTTEPSSKPMRQAWVAPSGAIETTKLIGTKVKTDQGKDGGEIDQLIVDMDGKVSHVVIGRGGVLGVGEQKVVLGWNDLKLQADPNNRNRMIATADQSKLDGAPRYEVRRDRDTAPAASPSTTPSTTPAPTTTPKK
jgi:hypothetical protein